MSRRRDQVAELRAKRLGNLATTNGNEPDQIVSKNTPTSLETIAQRIENESQIAKATENPQTVSQRYRDDIDPLLKRLERDTTQRLAEFVQEKYQYVNENKE